MPPGHGRRSAAAKQKNKRTEKQKNRKTEKAEKAEKNIIESRKNSVPARTDVYAVLFYTLISGPENEKVCSQIMP